LALNRRFHWLIELRFNAARWAHDAAVVAPVQLAMYAIQIPFFVPAACFILSGCHAPHRSIFTAAC